MTGFLLRLFAFGAALAVSMPGFAQSGVFQSTAPTLTNNQRNDLRLDTNGRLVVLAEGTTAPADASANSITGTTTNARTHVFNGTTWDRARGDTTGTYAIDIPSPLAVAGVVTVASSAVTGGQVIKASAGNLYGINVVAGASAGFIMVFNSTTVPIDGAVTPVRCIPLAANAGIDLSFGGHATHYSTGVSIAFSTTGCYTKTASATAFIAADVR